MMLIDVQALDIIGLLASFMFLGYSSRRDIASREVPDRVWFFSYPIGILLFAARLIGDVSSWTFASLSLLTAITISIALLYLGLWGGADGKAFVCLALMNPQTPTFAVNLLRVVDPLFPLVVFSNAYIASLACVLYCAQRNVRARHRLFENLEDESYLPKITAFLTGYRVRFVELESKSFLFPLESIRSEGSVLRRHFKLEMRIDTDREKELREIKEAFGSELPSATVWVTPGIPFLVFVTAGLALSVLVGDIVWHAVATLLGFVTAL